MQLIKAATTSLASKVVSQASEELAPLAVDAVLSVINPATATNVDLTSVRVVKASLPTIFLALVDKLVNVRLMLCRPSVVP
jgi:T-complex protein 1 subunit delta